MNHAELPMLAEIFRELRQGKHISIDDGPLYVVLRQQADAYQQLFAALGFQFIQHPRGFYYFESEAELSRDATQLAVFFFILIEAWAEAGHDLTELAFDPQGHRFDSLPHFSRPSWQNCMQEVGIEPDKLEDIVKRLERLGFARRVGEQHFTFRSPVWRFFELCLELRPAEGRSE